MCSRRIKYNKHVTVEGRYLEGKRQFLKSRTLKKQSHLKIVQTLKVTE